MKKLVSFRIDEEIYEEAMKFYEIDKDLYENKSAFMRFVFTLGLNEYRKLRKGNVENKDK